MQKKNFVNKIKDENPSIKSKRKKKTKVYTTLRKTKANNQQKLGEDLCKEESWLQNDN